MKHKITIILLLTSAILVINIKLYAQTPGFVQQDNIKVAGVTTDAQLYALPLAQKQTTRVFYDGLGRGVQTVAVQASPLQNDLIQPVAYDNLGRQTTAYLPYAGKSTDVMGSYRTNALSTDQAAFYNQTSQYLITTDAAPYNQQVFENSPLQRLLSSGMVGTGFQPISGQHYKTAGYRPNNSGDGNILVWNPDGTYTSGTYYAANTLSVTDGKDEDNVEMQTFTDLAGHVVLKRQLLSNGNLDTYYVYNVAGMLIYTIPPLATTKLATYMYSLTTAPLNKLVFHFVYDTRGRIVEKIVPSKGVMYIVYDPMNRPVLMQDSNMRVNNKWNYIKYDVKGRAISQGIYTDGTTGRTTRTGMQTYVTGLASSYATAWYESRTTVTSFNYYTNNVFPTANTQPLAYAYFDDYDVNNNGTADFAYSSQGLTGEVGATTATIKGMPTITIQNVVGSGVSSGTWLTKVVFYDKRGNPIQTRSSNHVYLTGTFGLSDISTMVPDFVGVPQITKVSKQTAASTTATVQTNLTYDHVYRITAIDQYYNGSATVNHVASYAYNEIGQVIKKSLGYVNPNWLQNVDMRYNIRGQLLSINNSTLTNDGGVTNGDTNDVFGMAILYNLTDSNIPNTAYYDGKLSAVKWMSKNASGTNSVERSYKFSYDGINQYLSAIYQERTTPGTGSFSNNADGFDEVLTYDNGGNVSSLTRNSSTQGTNTHVQIDNLSYTYNSTNPNQLQSVTESTDANHTGAGFRNLTGSTGSYTYDGNGNLSADPYKGLTLAYDVLNRTDKITVTTGINRWIDYTYNATGGLIRKRQYDNNVLQNTTDYIDGFVYINGVLSYFPMPEGRVLNTGSGGTVTLKQEFIISDQQGNARVSFQNNGSGAAVVTQENSYYPSGLIMPNSPVATPTTPNKQLYNGGSEWQNDYSNLPDYYQTFNRNYDAAIMRFVGVDPISESAAGMTSYQYAGNNPVMNNDPLGNLARPAPDPGNSSPTIHLHNGVLDQLNADMGTFFDGGGDSAGGDGGGGGGGGGGLTDAQWLFVTTVYNGGAIQQNYALDGDAGVFREVTNISGFSLGIAYENHFGTWGENGVASSLAAAVIAYDNDPHRVGPALTRAGTILNDHVQQDNSANSPLFGFYKDGKNKATVIGGVSGSGSLSGTSVNGDDDTNWFEGVERFIAPLDKGATLATSPGLLNNIYKNASEASVGLKWIGKFTGLTTIATSGAASFNDYAHGRWVSGTWNLAKAAGQGVILWGGGEEMELLWNTGTLATDGLIKLFGK